MNLLHWCAIATVVSPLVLWGGLPYPSASARFVWLAAVSVSAAIICAVLRARATPQKTGSTLIACAGLFFIATQLVATLFSNNPRDSFFGSFERALGVMMLVMAVPLFMALKETWTHAPKKIEGALIITCALMSIIAITQALFPQFLPTFSGSRVGGTLGNAVILGTYLSLTIIFIAARNERMRWYAVVTIMIGLFALALTQARASILTTVLVAGALVIIEIRRHRGQSQRASIIGIFLILVLLGALFTRLTESTTVASRIVNWRIAWRGFSERPIIGWGPGQYPDVVDANFDTELNRFGETESFPDKPHNFQLELAATSGAVGIIGYILLLCAVGATLIHLYKKNPAERRWIIIVAGFFIARELQLAFSFETHGSWIPTLIVLAALAARAPPIKLQFSVPPFVSLVAYYFGAIIIISIAWYGVIAPTNYVRAVMRGKNGIAPTNAPFVFELWDVMREVALAQPNHTPNYTRNFMSVSTALGEQNRNSARWQFALGVGASQLFSTTRGSAYATFAHQALERADELTPHRLPIKVQRAQLALAQKNFADAYQFANDAIQLNNGTITAHWIAASAALFLHDARAMWPHLQILIVKNFSFKKIPAPLMDAFIAQLVETQMTTEASLMRQARRQ